MHGGRTLMGLSAPRFKTGHYSKFLPMRLAAEYERASHDPELLALRRELAVVDVRINDLLRRVDTGESGGLWPPIRATWQTFKHAHAEGQPLIQGRAAAELDALLEQAISDNAAWHQIFQLIEQRRKLALSEAKRLVAMQQMMSKEQAMRWLGAVVAILKRHITDRETLQQISLDLSALVSCPSGTGGERSSSAISNDESPMSNGGVKQWNANKAALQQGLQRIGATPCDPRGLEPGWGKPDPR